MLPNGFRETFQNDLLSFVWRQWAQIGMASASLENRDGWAIDPEALLLLTSTIGRWDARLFDEAIDWTHMNCRFINMPRLKSLLKRYSFRSGRICAAISDTVVSANGRLNWRFPETDPSADPEPLFFGSDGSPMGGFGPTDPVFLRRGYERGVFELRGHSRRFNAVMPESALLRLRSLFGISARAEIVLYLTTHQIGHPSQIARETGFSKKNIQDTLVDMAASGIVHPAALEGRKKSYFIHSKNRAPLLYQPDSPPLWVAWRSRSCG